jgi:hypothetical protein
VVLADNVSVLPEQIGVVAVGAGVDGSALTVTVVVPAGELQLLAFVIVKVYVPVAAVVAPLIVGFCAVEENPFGPLQL